jgi:hypothetical protein
MSQQINFILLIPSLLKTEWLKQLENGDLVMDEDQQPIK